VIALDVSSTMLEYVKENAAKRGICNLESYNAGFLTYEHKGAPVDAVFSQLALHHLPDFWKLIALQKIHGILKYQGRLYLGDVIFSFPVEEYNHKIDNWIDNMKEKGGVDFAKDPEMHIKEEFSTFDWVMEEILTRAGFNIDEKDYIEGFMAVYICTI
jgi:putative AdoMet-dependent methyltransferase